MSKNTHAALTSDSKEVKQGFVRLDRHSGMGVRGLPKKGGLKGWGKLGEEEPVVVLDENDPNYISDEDRTEGTEIEQTVMNEHGQQLTAREGTQPGQTNQGP